MTLIRFDNAFFWEGNTATRKVVLLNPNMISAVLIVGENETSIQVDEVSYIIPLSLEQTLEKLGAFVK